MSETKLITVETERLLVIRRRYHAVEDWCAGCRGKVLHLRPDQAATFTRLTLREVFTRLEQGRLHFREAPDGMVLICLNTLLNFS